MCGLQIPQEVLLCPSSHVTDDLNALGMQAMHFLGGDVDEWGGS